MKERKKVTKQKKNGDNKLYVNLLFCLEYERGNSKHNKIVYYGVEHKCAHRRYIVKSCRILIWLLMSISIDRIVDTACRYMIMNVILYSTTCEITLNLVQRILLVQSNNTIHAIGWDEMGWVGISMYDKKKPYTVIIYF